MKTMIGLGSVLALVLVACSVTNGAPSTGTGSGTNGGGGGGDSDGGVASNSDGGSSSSSDGGGGSASDVIVSQTAANLTFGSCPAAAACGGDLEGTWDYTGGCIDDPFAAVKTQCPSATSSNVTGTIAGTVNFLGDVVYRKGKATFSGTITLPAACTMGAPCAAIATELKSAFDTVSCTGTASCDCAVTSHTDVDSSSTFTVSGNTLTTSTGGSYDFCVQGSQLTERESDSNPAEPGAFTLKKR